MEGKRDVEFWGKKSHVEFLNICPTAQKKNYVLRYASCRKILQRHLKV